MLCIPMVQSPLLAVRVVSRGNTEGKLEHFLLYNSADALASTSSESTRLYRKKKKYMILFRRSVNHCPFLPVRTLDSGSHR